MECHVQQDRFNKIQSLMDKNETHQDHNTYKCENNPRKVKSVEMLYARKRIMTQYCKTLDSSEI